MILEIIIVDDASPVNASDELEAFKQLYPAAHIRILSQTNSGPNTARNAALAQLDPASQMVAFLDSDDAWSEDHLERASQVLRLSPHHNAYFSNLRHLGAEGPAEFERAKRLQIEQHPRIMDNDETFRSYEGDMIDQIMRANTIFMPTLVITRALFDVRFDDGFRHGGGDYIYWLKLIEGGARFCFSTQVEVQCGSGVNMWYSNGWGSDGYVKRITGESEFRSRALEKYITEPATKTLVAAQLKSLRETVVLDTIHRVVRRKPLDLQALKLYRARFGLGLFDVLRALRSKL
jgi:succinoglycan biosynthesis protein ExoW